MLYNTKTVLSSFLGTSPLVGWRQNLDPQGDQLLDMLSSESGLHFNSQHALLTIENILSVAPDFEKYTYNDWSATDNYLIGAIRMFAGKNWQCILAHLNQTPTTPSIYWKEYNGFTSWLKEKTEEGILFSLNTWISKKIKNKSAKNLLKHNILFASSGNVTTTEAPTTGFCGYELIPVRNIGVKTKLHSISLHLETNQTVTINLFQSGIKAPIKSQDLVYTGAGSVQWFTLIDFDLPALGSYWVGYDGGSITDNIINGIRDFNYKAAGRNNFPCDDQYLNVVCFSNVSNGAELWDLSTNKYTVSTNYGMNLNLSVRCDYTSFLIDQKALFAEFISKGVGIYLLEQLMFNPEARANRNENNASQSMLIYERDGGEDRPGGLSKKFEEALDSIMIDFEGINKHCLPCKTTGVTIRAMG